MNIGMAGRLVAVPRIIGPVAPTQGLLRADAANLRIEQGQGVVEPVHSVLSNNPQEAHPSAHLDASRTGFLCLFDHFGLVSL